MGMTVRRMSNLFPDEACGPYGHDINLQEICAAWRKPPETAEMTKDEFDTWQRVEEEVRLIKRRKEEEEIRKFQSRGFKSLLP